MELILKLSNHFNWQILVKFPVNNFLLRNVNISSNVVSEFGNYFANLPLRYVNLLGNQQINPEIICQFFSFQTNFASFQQFSNVSFKGFNKSFIYANQFVVRFVFRFQANFSNVSFQALAISELNHCQSTQSDSIPIQFGSEPDSTQFF